MVQGSGDWRDYLGRAATIVLSAAVSALVTAGAIRGTAPRATAAQVEPQDEVRARAFVLVGPEGQIFGRLGVGGRGNGNLTLYDAAGTERLILGGLPVVALNGADGRRRMNIFAARDDNGEPGITVFGADGPPRLSFEATGDGGFRIVALDANGQSVATFPPSAP